MAICLGCDDFIEIAPPRTELVRQSVFIEDATAEAAVVDIYNALKTGFASGTNEGVTALAGLSSDELLLIPNESQPYQEFYNNQLLANNFILNSQWNYFYSTIYHANAAIEGISFSGEGLSKREQLLGEVKFVRAFCYFFLINLWGDVPLATTADYEKNNTLSRAPISDVYELIVTDLLEAQKLLANDYDYSDGERTRVNKGVATALLARVYLYRENWSGAEIEASKLINNSELYSLESDLNLVFRTSSSEAIFQLWNDRYPPERLTFRISSIYNGPRFCSLRESLFNSFESNDLRYINWVTSLDVSGTIYYGAVKYKSAVSYPSEDYSTVFRLAEQYLIRAEARAHQNNLVEAAEDINVIRTRAELPNTSASTQTELLEAIMEERYHELFSEWGHRWFDLKRTGKANEILAPVKSWWNNEDVLYPIPESH